MRLIYNSIIDPKVTGTFHFNRNALTHYNTLPGSLKKIPID